MTSAPARPRAERVAHLGRVRPRMRRSTVPAQPSCSCPVESWTANDRLSPLAQGRRGSSRRGAQGTAVGVPPVRYGDGDAPVQRCDQRVSGTARRSRARSPGWCRAQRSTRRRRGGRPGRDRCIAAVYRWMPRGSQPGADTASKAWGETTRVVKIVEKLLRAGEGRVVKRLHGLAAQVNALEDDFVRLTDAELREETDRFRAGSRTARRSTTCCPRRSPPSARRPSARSASATSTSS